MDCEIFPWILLLLFGDKIADQELRATLVSCKIGTGIQILSVDAALDANWTIPGTMISALTVAPHPKA